MPTYQYACAACDHQFEAIQSFSDDSLTMCPECKGEIRKVYTAVGVVFKGSAAAAPGYAAAVEFLVCLGRESEFAPAYDSTAALATAAGYVSG